MEIPYTVELRRDTGLNNGKIGIWLFLASEVMLFGALFASYILIRTGAPSLAARRHDPGRPARHVQHCRADLVLGHDGHGVGVADAPPLRDLPDLHGSDDPARGRLPRGQVLRIQSPFPPRRIPQPQQLPRALLHPHRPAHAARRRRDGGERVLLGAWREALEDQTPSGSPTESSTRACSGTSWIWSGSSCSRPCISCRRASMTSDTVTQSTSTNTSGSTSPSSSRSWC